VGGYDCPCDDGYIADGDVCADVNECASVSNHPICANIANGDNRDDNQVCDELDTADGRYDCLCTNAATVVVEKEGLLYCVDVDECSTGTPCAGDVNSHCVNSDWMTTGVEYTCDCNAGWVKDGDVCVDINECADPTICADVRSHCVNNDGGYTCECNDNAEAVSDVGTETICQDVDECSNGSHSCYTDATTPYADEGCTDANFHDTGSAFSCACPAESNLGDNGCEDINECLTTCLDTTTSTCTDSVHHETGVTHDCSCNTGYKAHESDVDICVDVDECDTGTPCTGEGARCENNEGSYECFCDYAGTILVGTNCVDVDECSEETHNCEQHCHNSMPSENDPTMFTCSCDSGYTQDDNTCNDINECEGTPCAEHATCDNNDGGYTCTCATEWSGEGSDAYAACTDTNECNGAHTCTEANNPDGVCENTAGSHNCICADGYEFVDDICVDIDECATGNHICEPSAVCENRNMRNDNNRYECVCPEGTEEHIIFGARELNPRASAIVTCADIDECANGSARCHLKADCTNTEYDADSGLGYTCSCKAGYEADADGTHVDIRDVGDVCVDINECDTGDNNCHENARCINNDGSFECRCKYRYTGDGVDCTDYNECANGLQDQSLLRGRRNRMDPLDVCPTNSVCVNYPTEAHPDEVGYNCECKSGYEATNWDVEGVVNKCSDIDECDTGDNNCNVNASCANNKGSFDCACNEGFTGDGVDCNDVDECDDGTDNCDDNATCTNTFGSWTCACNSGWNGDGLTCANINECDVSDECHDNSDCIDNAGSYCCLCHFVYDGIGLNCNNVN
jgi:hypothetical protein